MTWGRLKTLKIPGTPGMDLYHGEGGKSWGNVTSIHRVFVFLLRWSSEGRMSHMTVAYEKNRIFSFEEFVFADFSPCSNDLTGICIGWWGEGEAQIVRAAHHP